MEVTRQIYYDYLKSIERLDEILNSSETYEEKDEDSFKE